MDLSQLYTPDCIMTQSGIFVNVIDPKPEMFIIEDIAHALCHIPRFVGHSKAPYSVASHSMEVAKLVSKPLQLEALLHDATEAFLCDIPSPLKKHLPGYQKIEKRMYAVIAERFGFPAEMSKEVKLADRHCLEQEWEGLFGEEKNLFGSYVSTNPLIVKYHFLEMYKGLTQTPY